MSPIRANLVSECRHEISPVSSCPQTSLPGKEKALSKYVSIFKRSWGSSQGSEGNYF